MGTESKVYLENLINSLNMFQYSIAALVIFVACITIFAVMKLRYSLKVKLIIVLIYLTVLPMGFYINGIP